MKGKLVLSGALFVLLLGQIVRADCPTGYACLLKDIKQQDNVIYKMQKSAVKQIYDPDTVEPYTNDKSEQKHSYKDLLPFAPKFCK